MVVRVSTRTSGRFWRFGNCCSWGGGDAECDIFMRAIETASIVKYAQLSLPLTQFLHAGVDSSHFIRRSLQVAQPR